MECPGCGREVVPRGVFALEQRWCSRSCRRSTFRRLRDVSLYATHWSAALEMPDVLRERDDLARRVAKTAAPAHRVPEAGTYDPAELPLYC